MRREYIVTTTSGLYKITSRSALDLLSAEKMLNKAGNPAKILLIRELNFFEKVVDKIRNR